MAITHLVSAIASANTDPETAGLNTTTATLLTVAVSWLGTEPTISDNRGNTGWKKRSTRTNGDQKIAIWDCVPTSVGTGHTFKATGTGIYASLYVAAFAGSHASAPYSAESAGGTGTGSAAQPGTRTPAVNDCLLVTAISLYDNTSAWAINEGFTILQANSAASFNPRGGGLAYKIQTTAAAQNPQWSWSGGSIYAATMVVYLPAASASSPLLLRLQAEGLFVGANH